MWPLSYKPASVLTSMILTSGLSRFFSSQSVCTTARAKFFGAAIDGATDIPATSPTLIAATISVFFLLILLFNIILSCFLLDGFASKVKIKI